MTIPSDWQLEIVRRDAEFVLYRGQRGGVSAPMLVLAPASDQPESRSLQRLEHEYALRDELDPEWAVRALELVRYEGRPILLFADPGGDFLDRHVGQPIALTPFLRIAIALASALARLHGRGIDPQGHQACERPRRSGDRRSLADRLRHRLPPAPRAAGS